MVSKHVGGKLKLQFNFINICCKGKMSRLPKQAYKEAI